LYTVKITRLPLPRWPLSEGHSEARPGPDIRPPDVYSSEPDALEGARGLVQQGYGVSIGLPDGREWLHAELLHRLNGG
jgi:hypothetical protein